MFPPLIYDSSNKSTFVRHLEALRKIQESKKKNVLHMNIFNRQEKTKLTPKNGFVLRIQIKKKVYTDPEEPLTFHRS